MLNFNELNLIPVGLMQEWHNPPVDSDIQTKYIQKSNVEMGCGNLMHIIIIYLFGSADKQIEV